jgi:hypothetical protein
MSEPTKSAPAPTATPRWATTVAIPTTWTPEQALAVFELIDDLRDKIWPLHGRQIQHILQQEQGSADGTAHHAEPISDNTSF